MVKPTKEEFEQEQQELATAVNWPSLLQWVMQFAPFVLEILKKWFPVSPEDADEEHPNYVTAFPISCIKEVIDILKGGTGSVQVRISEFAKHAWVIQSYLLGVLFGDPDVIKGEDAPPVSDQVAKLEELLDSLQNLQSTAFEEDGKAEAIDPALMALIVQLILKFLQRFKPKT